MGSGIGLQMEDVLPGESLAISGNWLLLGGAVLRVSKAPDIKASETYGFCT